MRSRSLILAFLLAMVAGLAVASDPQPFLNAYFARGFEDAEWQKQAIGQVGKLWKVPRPLPEPGKKAVVVTNITRSGVCLDLKLHLATGNEGFDQAALKAIREAQPFPKLPPGWRQGSLEVHWHFAVK